MLSPTAPAALRVPIPGRKGSAARAGSASMTYYVVLTIHLLCAFVFVGTVFFEVLILQALHGRVSPRALAQVERAIGDRARRLMPWVLLAMYGAGIALAWQHRGALRHPLSSAFGVMLTIKVALAIGVFGHFLHAMHLRRSGRLTGTRSRRLHLSVFVHVVLIVLLAKGLFHLAW